MKYEVKERVMYGVNVEKKLKDAFLMLCKRNNDKAANRVSLMMADYLLAQEDLQQKLPPDLWRWCEGNLARVKGQITGAGWVTDAGVEIF
jgi:hypothetical protein